jgi:UDP-3-O-[3-hydroxymyristoyl] N-acetylglucosamine deacetylase / 3-hydroxyacyl-[acyl-carrier-protein] dehydratase
LFNIPVLQQQTIREPIVCSGAGLHSGNRVNMTIYPASANAGIRFRRVDLADKPEIEARIDQVAETSRSTTLALGHVKIHTIEHVLAALAGCGVDNAIIELDANEPPIMDGSSRQFCHQIKAAGLETQTETRDPIYITTPIHFQAGETTMSVFPHDRLMISCTSADRQGRFTQFYALEVTEESFERELAPARTFCFFEEIEMLIRNGLIKGGSLENAVIIREDAVLTTEPLRFPEEFVRHKMLDLIGDLSLLGRPVCGHVVAIKPNHASNCELVRRIRDVLIRPLQMAQSFAPPPGSGTSAEPALTESVVRDGVELSTSQIMQVLPHRYPFLMVDKVVKIDGNHIIGLKNVTINEPYFQGHFPVHPIMPGVLQLEAIAQVAGILMLRQAEYLGKLAFFMSAENVKWRKPVSPGDTLMIEVELTKNRGRIGRAKGWCRVNEDVVSEAEITFMLIDSQLAQP